MPGGRKAEQSTMALEDYMEPEVGIAVAVTAAVASPQVRNVLRRGAVYGLAGLLMAGDAVSALAQGVKRGAQQAAPPEAAAAPVPDTAPATPEILSTDSPVVAAPAMSAAQGAPTSEAAEVTPAGLKRTRKAAEAALPEAAGNE